MTGPTGPWLTLTHCWMVLLLITDSLALALVTGYLGGRSLSRPEAELHGLLIGRVLLLLLLLLLLALLLLLLLRVARGRLSNRARDGN
jgi:membrane protein DedA with SNARE-associated domain